MSTPIKTRFITSTRKLSAQNNLKQGVTTIVLGSLPIHRMRSYGATPLLNIEGKKIIEHIVDSVNVAIPNSEIILTIGFHANKVIKEVPEGIRIVENQLYDRNNIIEEARLAINNSIYNKVLIVCGSTIFNHYTLDNITQEGSSIIVDSKGQMPEDNVGATVVDDNVTIFSYGVKPAWCELVFLTGRELSLFKAVVNNPSMKNCLLFEALNKVIDNGGKFKPLEPRRMEVYKIENSKDII